MNRKNGFWIAIWLVLIAVTGYFAFFHAPYGSYGPWHGWGRMHGWSDARHPAFREFGGRMGGMMGPYGGWPDGITPGYFPPQASAVNEEQARQIRKLQDEMFERNRKIMQQAWEAQARLNRLYSAEKRDWDAIRADARQLNDLQRQQLDAAIDLQQKIDALLNGAQRKP